MSLPDNLSTILDRIENNKQTEADIAVLRRVLSGGDHQLSIQLGKYNVNIGEGKEIHIGDRIQIWVLGEETALHTFEKTIFSNFFDVFGFDSIIFSPNGKLIAANDNQDIKLWNVATGKEIAKLSGHSDKVTCVAFDPQNSRIIASCSYDKTIKLWDIDSKRCLRTLPANRDAVYTLAFSPDGEILASGGNDNAIKLWYLNSGELPQTLRQHSDAVTCLVFSPDGKTLVSGSNDETIVEWNIATKELRTTFPERHRRGVTSIAFNPNGETLISGGRDQTIKVWRRQV